MVFIRRSVRLYSFSFIVDLHFRYFFAKKFQHIVEIAAAKKAAGLSLQPAANHRKPWPKRLTAFITGSPVVNADVVDNESMTIRKLTPDMIRRMDEPPKLINPSGNSSGWVSELPSHGTTSHGFERPFTPTAESLSNRQACRSASLDINQKQYVARLVL
jgi:hypothetical protein